MMPTPPTPHRARPLVLTVLVAAVLLLAAPAAFAEHFDVYVLAGQSNMDGRGDAAKLVGDLAAYAKPQADVQIIYSTSDARGPVYTSGGWRPLSPGYSVPPSAVQKEGKAKVPGGSFGPEVAFGRAVADAAKGKRVALIKFAEGGTSLREHWDPAKRGKLYDQFTTFVRASLKSITDRGDTYDLRAVCWHQGESDAGRPAEEYRNLLTSFITKVREDLGPKDLPFVLGQVFENGKRDAIRTAQVAVAKALPNIYLVSSAGLKTSDKDTHFDAAGQIELGLRFARAALTRANADAAH